MITNPFAPPAPRPPVFYSITTQNPFPLDYKNRNYVYMFCTTSFILTSNDFGAIAFLGSTWNNINLPETTRLTLSDTGGAEVHVQCVDVPLTSNVVQTPRLLVDVLGFGRKTVTSYSTGLLDGGNFSELAIDFTVYSIQGGTAPTITFLVSRQGLDGQLYQLEKAAAISAPGAISYSIGAGLDGKSFASKFQVDMITTGSPTSVDISASIKAKQ